MTNMNKAIEAAARAYDPEAWEAIEDGPYSMWWNILRKSALERSEKALSAALPVLAEGTGELCKRLRAAFDGESIAAKNTALRKAFDTITAQAAEIERLDSINEELGKVMNEAAREKARAEVAEATAERLRNDGRRLEQERGDWTGQSCAECQGTGETVEARACSSCAGTGEEWSTWKDRDKMAEAEVERLRGLLREARLDVQCCEQQLPLRSRRDLLALTAAALKALEKKP